MLLTQSFICKAQISGVCQGEVMGEVAYVQRMPDEYTKVVYRVVHGRKLGVSMTNQLALNFTFIGKHCKPRGRAEC